MLHEEMSASDLSIEILLVREPFLVQVRRMVLAHVVLERVAIGVWWWFPFALLGVCVEIVRQVLAVGVSNLLIMLCKNVDHTDRC